MTLEPLNLKKIKKIKKNTKKKGNSYIIVNIKE